MNARRPTPISATNFVSEERDLALRRFLSPLGSRARQTSVTGHDPEAWPTFKKALDFYD